MEQERRHTREALARSESREGTGELDDAIAENLESMRAESRWALACWRPVAGQVHMLSEQVTKKEHVRLILDASAVRAQMDWRDVPNAARARVWDLVMFLHDRNSHGGEGHSEVCVDHAFEERLLDPECWKCDLWLEQEGLSRGAS